MKDLRIFRKKPSTLTDVEIKSHLKFHAFDDDDTTSDLEKIAALKSLIQQFQEEGAAFDAKYSLISNPNLLATLPRKTADYPSHWGVLKPIFVQVVSKHCPICSASLGRYNGDVDHYRPKSLYQWLAYEFLNYILLCADCNRAYKRALFPILGTRATPNTVNLNDEQPLIINPLMDNPFDYFKLKLLSKGGSSVTNNMRIWLVPSSSDKDSYAYKRAIATIETFNLDNSRPDKNNYSDRVSLSQKVCNSLIDLANKKIRYDANKNPQNFKQFINQIKKTKENHGGSWLQFILEGKFEII